MFKVKQPLFNEDGGIGAASGEEVVPAAGEQAITQVDITSETGAEKEVVADPEKQNNYEKAFAKRLAAKEAEWEAKNAEKYKDYDVLKKTSEYFAKINNVSDVMTLAERIEMEQLQDAAEKQQVPVEVLQRIKELETKASKGEELEKTFNEQKQQQSYWDSVNKFSESKEIDGKALNQFMVDNQMTYDPNNMEKSFEIAFKAMNYDNVMKEQGEAEKAGMKKLLQAKGSIPTVGGNKQPAQVTQGPPKTWAEARQRAMGRDYNPI